MLKSKSTYARQVASHALGQIGPKASIAVPALKKALEDETAAVRSNALFSLWKIGEQEFARKRFLEGFEHKDVSFRASTAKTIRSLGEEGRFASRHLRNLLKDPDPWPRLQAGFSLWKMERDVDACLTTLKWGMKHSDYRVRAYSIWMIEQMDEAGKSLWDTVRGCTTTLITM